MMMVFTFTSRPRVPMAYIYKYGGIANDVTFRHVRFFSLSPIHRYKASAIFVFVCSILIGQWWQPFLFSKFGVFAFSVFVPFKFVRRPIDIPSISILLIKLLSS